VSELVRSDRIAVLVLVATLLLSPVVYDLSAWISR
jgi:hypothetical protein